MDDLNFRSHGLVESEASHIGDNDLVTTGSNDTVNDHSKDASVDNPRSNMGGDEDGESSTSHTDGPNAKATKKPMHDVLVSLCTSSIITFIGNELPALRAHLTDENLQDLKSFVAGHLAEHGALKGNGRFSTAESDFLFKSTLSVSAKLHLPLLRAARDRQTVPVRGIQLAGEVARLEWARDLGEMITERGKKAAAREGKNRGCIGMLGREVVFGPARAPGHKDDDGDGNGGASLPTGMMYINTDSIESMQRLSARKND